MSEINHEKLRAAANEYYTRYLNLQDIEKQVEKLNLISEQRREELLKQGDFILDLISDGTTIIKVTHKNVVDKVVVISYNEDYNIREVEVKDLI